MSPVKCIYKMLSYCRWDIPPKEFVNPSSRPQDINGSRTYQLILQKMQLLPDAAVTKQAIIDSLPIANSLPSLADTKSETVREGRDAKGKGRDVRGKGQDDSSEDDPIHFTPPSPSPPETKKRRTMSAKKTPSKSRKKAVADDGFVMEDIV
jgi:hypothetical protein